MEEKYCCTVVRSLTIYGIDIPGLEIVFTLIARIHVLYKILDNYYKQYAI